MALNLPLELQQHIFSFLDPRTFYASRNVCRWWNYASTDSVTLTRQLNKLPIEPHVSAARTSSARLQSLYNEASETLLLGKRASSPESSKSNLLQSINEHKVAISKDQKRAVSLNARTIFLYDTSAPDCPVIAQRPLNDLRTAVGGGPWFKCAPTSVYELALSSNGRLLAIALERTIQIYDLEDEPDSWPVSAYISSAAGHFIAGIQFECNDNLLRVQLSNKGTVLYLGSPGIAPANLRHWQDRGGLKHAFLDSSKLAIRPAPPSRVERLAGVQLLGPFGKGWLFAAQKHGGEALSSYCIGYIGDKDVHSDIATVDSHAVILVTLPSAHSSVATLESVGSLCEKLPTAHEQYPYFSLSADGSLLALAETGTKYSSVGRTSTAFAYRLPSRKQLRVLLEQEKALLVSAEQKEQTSDLFSIQRIPMTLGDIKGRILDFELVDEPLTASFNVQATTEFGTTTWSLSNSWTE